MSESQDGIDELLAEVSALADEAVSDVAGDGGESSSQEVAETSSFPQKVEPAQSLPSAHPAPVPQSRKPRSLSTRQSGDIQRILYLEVPVIVQLATRTMPLSEIMSLSTGAIIEFEKPSDSKLDLMINNKCIGYGQAVKVGENFGLRVTNVGSVKDRIKALGGE